MDTNNNSFMCEVIIEASTIVEVVINIKEKLTEAGESGLVSFIKYYCLMLRVLVLFYTMIYYISDSDSSFNFLLKNLWMLNIFPSEMSI